LSRRYANPPVIEALCEVYFRGSAWDATVPGTFYQRVRERFPKKGETRDFEIEVGFSPAALSTKAAHPELRSQFSREDGSRMIQLRRDLIVVNQLRPYPHFEEWRPEVVEGVRNYRELANPAGIAQIGVRYLNRIEVPSDTVKMEDYFQLYPEIPAQLGAMHGSFMMRVQIPALHEDHQLIVTFGSATAPQAGGSTAWLLDLYDIVASAEYPQIDAFEKPLDEAHENIERAFESIITDATRALFGEIS